MQSISLLHLGQVVAASSTAASACVADTVSIDTINPLSRLGFYVCHLSHVSAGTSRVPGCWFEVPFVTSWLTSRCRPLSFLVEGAVMQDSYSSCTPFSSALELMESMIQGLMVSLASCHVPAVTVPEQIALIGFDIQPM